MPPNPPSFDTNTLPRAVNTLPTLGLRKLVIYVPPLPHVCCVGIAVPSSPYVYVVKKLLRISISACFTMPVKSAVCLYDVYVGFVVVCVVL